MLEQTLSRLPHKFNSARLPSEVLLEAKKRVVDTLACFYGAFDAKPGRLVRETFTTGLPTVAPRRSRSDLWGAKVGECALWGTPRRVPAELAAWANGTCVRTLDYNDTYLSLEPCHPSDLMASLWAACELSVRRGEQGGQGLALLKAMVLGYEVLCRLCDAGSLRMRGWDHVTYLPIASAVACSWALGLSPAQAGHAVSLAAVGNNALRQTRVGEISDWKAACAAYAARAGLAASRLAAAGFTGPIDIFSGRHGFYRHVSGPLHFSNRSLGRGWKILSTHTKFFPAEHHAQSAIEAALRVRAQMGKERIREVVVECFDAAVQIIGSEEEKWRPATRETADHSMAYLVAAALLDGDITLGQYEKKRYLDGDVRRLMARIKVRASKKYSALYPRALPTRVSVRTSPGAALSHEVLRPKGYAGRPMTPEEVEEKFRRLSARHLSGAKQDRLLRKIWGLEKVSKLSEVTSLLSR